jgi:hypothetical protein
MPGLWQLIHSRPYPIRNPSDLNPKPYDLNPKPYDSFCRPRTRSVPSLDSPSPAPRLAQSCPSTRYIQSQDSTIPAPRLNTRDLLPAHRARGPAYRVLGWRNPGSLAPLSAIPIWPLPLQQHPQRMMHRALCSPTKHPRLGCGTPHASPLKQPPSLNRTDICPLINWHTGKDGGICLSWGVGTYSPQMPPPSMGIAAFHAAASDGGEILQ